MDNIMIIHQWTLYAEPTHDFHVIFRLEGIVGGGKLGLTIDINDEILVETQLEYIAEYVALKMRDRLEECVDLKYAKGQMDELTSFIRETALLLLKGGKPKPVSSTMNLVTETFHDYVTGGIVLSGEPAIISNNNPMYSFDDLKKKVDKIGSALQTKKFVGKKTTWVVSCYLDNFDQLHIQATDGLATYSTTINSTIFKDKKGDFHQIIDNVFDPIIEIFSAFCDYIFELCYLATNSDRADWKFTPDLEKPYEESGIWHVKFVIMPEAVDEDPSELAVELPGINEIIKNPVTGLDASLYGVIMDLNDTQKWSRDAIADWIETLDIDTRFRLEDENEQD